MTALVLRDVRLVDGTGSDPVDRVTVVVIDNRIADIGPDPHVGHDARTIDGSGRTLTPGLIDAHAHLGLATPMQDLLAGRLSVAEIAAAIFEVTGDVLPQGFTTVRDVGGIDAGLVAAVTSGKVRGPRIWHAGAILCQRGGHGHLADTWEPTERWADHAIPGLSTVSVVCDGPDEVRRAARENFRRGASFLKMCVTGGVVSLHDNLTDTQFTTEEIRAAVVEAEARGSYVTVHAHNNAGIRNAIDAGVRCVEHGTQIDADLAALMADRGVAHVPTLTVAATLAANADTIGLAAGTAERSTGLAEEMITATKLTADAGVTVGSGADLFGPGQGTRGMELQLKAGVIGAMAALESATRVNAQIMGIADQLGTIEVGKLADLTLWDGDPLTDPALFADRAAVALVVHDGTVAFGTFGGRPSAASHV